MNGSSLWKTLLAVCLLASGGCHWRHDGGQSLADSDLMGFQNPLFVGGGDRDVIWEQVVDSLDDYFRIRYEQRVRLVGDVLLEGRIETFPVDGSTILEPWRKDSTHGFEKLHATLQSVRRRALVRVMPAEGGYLIDIAVYKELEDLNRPQNGTVADVDIYRDRARADKPQELYSDEWTLGWIPIGRDVSLEQQILSDIQARLTR